MGVADNDWDFVLRCLGDTPEDIPVVSIARNIADVMRIHALDRRGDTARADAYFAAMCKKTSTAHVAKAFSRAPAAWHVHPRFINKPLRERVRQHAQFVVFLSGLMGILAAGLAYNVMTNHPDEAAVLFLLLPLALIAMGFLLRAARRRFRLAREGLIGVGVVISISTQGGSGKKAR